MLNEPATKKQRSGAPVPTALRAEDFWESLEGLQEQWGPPLPRDNDTAPFAVDDAAIAYTLTGDSFKLLRQHFFATSKQPHSEKLDAWRKAAQDASKTAARDSDSLAYPIMTKIAKRWAKAVAVGLGLDERMVEVPKLKEKRGRIPRADGKTRKLNDKIQRFTKNWVESWFNRVRLLNENLTYRFLSDLSGAINTSVTMLFDVEDVETKVTRSREEIKRLSELASQRAKDLTGVEAELRKQVNTIKMATQVIQTLDEQQPLVNAIEDALGQLSPIVSKLLDLEQQDKCNGFISIMIMPFSGRDNALKRSLPTRDVALETMSFYYFKQMYEMLSNSRYRDLVVRDPITRTSKFGSFVTSELSAYITSCGDRTKNSLVKTFTEPRGSIFSEDSLESVVDVYNDAIELWKTKDSVYWATVADRVVKKTKIEDIATEMQPDVGHLGLIFSIFLAVEMLKSSAKSSESNAEMAGALSNLLVQALSATGFTTMGTVNDVKTIWLELVKRDVYKEFYEILQSVRTQIQNEYSATDGEAEDLIRLEMPKVAEELRDIDEEDEAADLLEMDQIGPVQEKLREIQAGLRKDLGDIPGIVQIRERSEEEVERLQTLLEELDEQTTLDLYSHSAEWALRPENSGFIQVDPFVSYAIKQAFNKLVMAMPDLAEAGVERLQQDPVAGPIFVSMVANEIADSRTNAPAGIYLAAHIVKQIKLKAVDTAQRLSYLEYDAGKDEFYFTFTDGGYGRGDYTQQFVDSLFGRAT